MADEELPTQELEDGATVRLKSGGPTMTVSGYGRYTGQVAYACRWWDEKQKKFVSETFKAHELERAQTSQHSSGGPLRGLAKDQF